MKLAAFLLITISLVLGVIGAVTAYLPPLSLPDETFRDLQLNSPAGLRITDSGKREPIAIPSVKPAPDKPPIPGTQLTPEVLAELRAAGVERIRVKEFSLARWPEWWMFTLGCIGLGVGAAVVRRENRRAIAAAGKAQSAAGTGPDESLSVLRAEIDRLRRDLPTLPSTEARLQAILASLGEAQRTTIPAFIAARPTLIARLGLGGFARLMDSFAAAERQINRAWSAAADDVEPEALTCLDQAAALLAETQPRLNPTV